MGNIFEDSEMQEIFEGYLVESNELLDNISNDLMLIESEPDNLDLINQLFRGFHTIKGTSSFMGFEEITKITHEAEDLLNKLRRSELSINQDILDVLFDVHDWIRKLIDKVIAGDQSATDYSVTIAKIKLLRDGEQVLELVEVIEEMVEEKSSKSSKKQTKTPKTSKKAEAKSGGALDKVMTDKSITSGSDDFTEDELALIQAAFAELNSNFVAELPAKPEISASNGISNGEHKTETAKEENVKVETKVETNIQPAFKKTDGGVATENAPKSMNETIRIEVNRLETLMDLSGELVLARNRLAQMTKHLVTDNTNKDKIKDLFETTSQIDFVTSEIQSAVMSMRMVQIGKLYQKAPRMVRDLSKEFNKQISLVVKGEETEIDRSIIEELNDPLVHMIRNSCDHGIESPELRVSNGKSPNGTITLDAEQEGNNIVIKISDDGAGMDPDKLRNKAIEKGLLTKEAATQMSDKDAFQIIFMPGFSTAAKITNTSGRGVGMDVVRTNIQKLKGFIEIDSEINKGSTFIIKLPLTLAIIQGLLVKIKHETYAVPLGSVEEVVSNDPGLIKTINQQEVITIRDQVCPVIKLSHVVHLDDDDENSIINKYIVIVRLGIERVGIIVDDLLGQQEIVIKSIGEYLGQVYGIAGSTILGDGRVIMIIDIAEMIQSLQKNKK